jgi:RHS repeat-associated protein
LRYETARRVQSALFDHTNGAANGYSERLSGGTNEKYGVAKSISVMPGDTIRMEVFAKYVDPTATNTQALNDFIAAVANGTAPAGTVIDGASYSTSTSGFVFDDFFTYSPTNDSAPEAYLNYIMFDRDYQPIWDESQTHYVKITTSAQETGSDGALERVFAEVVAAQAGYMYIYLSNDNPQPVEVYFDDFKVGHVKSPVVQMEDYYPFGLTFNSYQRENSTENRYLYNQGAGEKKFNTERIFDLGLNIDLTKFRAYDPAIGKWWQVDPLADEGLLASLTPYNYSNNNPVLYNDPYGDCLPCLVIPLVEVVVAVAEGATFAAAGTAAAVGVKGLVENAPDGALTSGPAYSPAVGFAMSSASPGELTSGNFFKNSSQKASTQSNSTNNNQAKVTMPNGTELPKLPKGKGSVPPDQRDPKRVPTESEKKKMYDERGQKCEGCDQPKDIKELRSHHATGRHADGTPTTPKDIRLLCVECHKLPHGYNGPPTPQVPPPPPAQ